MARRLALAVAALLLLSASADAQSIILVRHAERADTVAGAAPTMAADPDLSAAGVERARRLAVMLKDAGITAVHVTQFKRTQQTAAPLAAAIGVTPTVSPAAESAALVATLRAATGNVLVVGHSNTVPEIVAALGVTPVFTIGDAEYDNLLVVSLTPTPRLLRLRY